MATKEVFYDIYCENCLFKDLPETEDPCDTCLDYPSNEDSHKPLYFKPKSDKLGVPFNPKKKG